MPKGCKIFLFGLLIFATLMGGFCILFPLISQYDPNPYAPQPTTKPDQTEDGTSPNEPEEGDGTEEGKEDPTPEEPALTDLQLAAAPLVAEMTLKEKIYQLFIVTPEQITDVDTVILAGSATKDALQEHPVGGLVYFAKNLQSRDQVKTMQIGRASCRERV